MLVLHAIMLATESPTQVGARKVRADRLTQARS